eukprot:Gb_30497 [translate_table: standard]
MAESSKNVSNNIEWKITVPEGSIELKQVPNKRRLHNRVSERVRQTFEGLKSGFIGLGEKVWKLGADDPRRIFHSFKVGLALALVSLFYFMHPLFHSVGGTALWAVMTVVVVFEFTAGATLCKGLNRMFATLLAVCLAVGVNNLADLAGDKAEPIILGISVFLLGSASTFSRFFPTIKARYDYGVLIFILTFSFMSVSGYRVENLFVIAYERVATIIIGCVLCIIISVIICPIWAGEDLHRMIIRNLEGLADSFEGCVTEYFSFVESSDDEDHHEDKVPKGYKCILNSKATEESLANFARWEPAHGQFGFRYPWKQYVKIGAMMRYCAYCVEALNGCLNSEIQVPYFLRAHLKAPCMSIAAESSNVLMQLAESIRTMTRCSNVDFMMARLNTAVEELQNCLRAQPELFIDSKRWHIIEETPQTHKESIPPVHDHHPKDHVRPSEISDKKKILMLRSVNHEMGTHVMQVHDHDQETCNSNNQRRISGWPQEPAVNVDASKQSVAFMDTLPLATVACLLTEIVARLESVVAAVDNLGERANFKIVDDKPTVVATKIIPNSTSHPTTPTPTKPPPQNVVVDPLKAVQTEEIHQMMMITKE